MSGRLLGKGLPTIDLAHGDLTGGEQCPEQHGGGLRRGQHRLCLDAALELLVQPLDRIGNWYEDRGARSSRWDMWSWRMVRPSGTRGTGSTSVGRPILDDEPRARRERGSVVVVLPTCSRSATSNREHVMKRVIGMDIHRTFAEVVIWEAGQLRPAGRVDMSRAGLEGFGRTLSKEEDEVVIEATGNAMAVVRALEPHVARVIVANPTQVVGAGPNP